MKLLNKVTTTLFVLIHRMPSKGNRSDTVVGCFSTIELAVAYAQANPNYGGARDQHWVIQHEVLDEPEAETPMSIHLDRLGQYPEETCSTEENLKVVINDRACDDCGPIHGPNA